MTLPGRRTLRPRTRRQRTRRRRMRRGATIVLLVGLLVWITPGTAEAGPVPAGYVHGHQANVGGSW